MLLIKNICAVHLELNCLFSFSFLDRINSWIGCLLNLVKNITKTKNMAKYCCLINLMSIISFLSDSICLIHMIDEKQASKWTSSLKKVILWIHNYQVEFWIDSSIPHFWNVGTLIDTCLPRLPVCPTMKSDTTQADNTWHWHALIVEDKHNTNRLSLNIFLAISLFREWVEINWFFSINSLFLLVHQVASKPHQKIHHGNIQIWKRNWVTCWRR